MDRHGALTGSDEVSSLKGRVIIVTGKCAPSFPPPRARPGELTI